MFKPFMRHPRTTQERRASGKWVRAKRNASNLPNAWDDFIIRHEKSWKNKRKTQYRINSRGQQHSIYLKDSSYNWQTLCIIKKYFEKYDIPYRIEKDLIRHIWYEYIDKKRVEIGIEKYVYYRTEKREYYIYRTLWENRILDKPYWQKRTWFELKGYNIVYWYRQPFSVIDSIYRYER